MPLKKCPYCKGMHRTRRAFLKCQKRNHKESWK
jgi:hypothetical protein